MKKTFDPGRVSSYFQAEWRSLFVVTVSGLLYNLGLLAGPLFEGRLAQCLLNILAAARLLQTWSC